MADVTIVCLTHGRAGLVTAFDAWGDDLLLSVAASQAPLYREAYPDARLDVHPDDVVGLAAKKNWVMDAYPDGVFMVDDDCGPMVDMTRSEKVAPATAVSLVHRLADQAEQMGAKMFGFSSDMNPMHFSPQRPFSVTEMIDGGHVGWLPGADVWCPPDLSVAEDIWFAALNAFKHRFCLKDLRYAFDQQVGQAGGLANERTSRSIDLAAERLVEAFGDAITLKPRSDARLYNWRYRCPW